MSNVSAIKKTSRASAPEAWLTESPEETPYRVACVLRYLASVSPTDDNSLSTDEDFGRFIILQECADALNWLRAVRLREVSNV